MFTVQLKHLHTAIAEISRVFCEKPSWKRNHFWHGAKQKFSVYLHVLEN